MNVLAPYLLHYKILCNKVAHDLIPVPPSTQLLTLPIEDVVVAAPTHHVVSHSHAFTENFPSFWIFFSSYFYVRQALPLLQDPDKA